MLKRILASVPLLLPTAALICGIVAGVWAPWQVLPAVMAAGVALLFKWRYAGAMTMMFCAGFILSLLAAPNPTPELPPCELTYSAKVRNVSETNSGTAIRVEIDGFGQTADSILPCRTFPASVLVTGGDADVYPYERVFIHAKFAKIEPRTDIPDEFNGTVSLKSNGIEVSAVITSDDINPASKQTDLRYITGNASRAFCRTLYRTDLSPQAKTFLATVITGQTTMLGSDSRTTFAEAGLAHILALSGMHVGLIAMIISLALWPIRLSGHIWPEKTIMLFFLWAYALAAGLAPSVTRAVIMATVYTIGTLAMRNRSSFNSLCFAALAILLFSPYSLFSRGFQLSFIAVASILIFAEKLNPFKEHKGLLNNIGALIAVSAAAMLGTGFLSIVYFHNLPVYFLISNIVASLLLPFAMCGGMLVTLLGSMGINLHLLTDATSLCCAAIEGTAEFVASLPGSSISGIYFPAWTVLPYFLTLALFALALHTHRRRFAIAASAFICLFVIITALLPKHKIENRLYFINDPENITAVYPSAGEKTLHIISLAPFTAEQQLITMAKERFADYMLMRGIDKINIETIRSAEKFADRIRTLTGEDLDIIANDTYTPERKCRYIMIAPGARNNIGDRIAAYADTAVTSSNINRKLYTRISRECTEAGVPLKAIHITTFSLPLRR